MAKRKLLFTLGHSTHTTREFLNILKSYDVEVLVDVRHYPGSRYCPQFGQTRLKRNLTNNAIEYVHLESLGGRRRPDKESSENAGWRSAQFRGYADHMQTPEFKSALNELVSLAKSRIVAIMCSEAVPWRCHRSMIGDAMLIRGFEVIDIFSEKQSRPHKITPFAHTSGKKITYPSIDEV